MAGVLNESRVDWRESEKRSGWMASPSICHVEFLCIQLSRDCYSVRKVIIRGMGTMVSTHLSSPAPSSTWLLLTASTNALMSALRLTLAICVVWRCYCHFWKLLPFLNSTFSWFSFYLSSLSFLVSLAGSSSSVHLLMLLFIIGPFSFPLALSGRSHPFPCLRMITNNQ